MYSHLPLPHVMCIYRKINHKNRALNKHVNFSNTKKINLRRNNELKSVRVQHRIKCT